jgi:hypothetical protein
MKQGGLILRKYEPGTITIDNIKAPLNVPRKVGMEAMNPKPQPKLGIALAAAVLLALPQVASADVGLDH